jgi:hypothetical protein
VRFLDTWTQLPALDLARLLLPALCFGLVIGIPGRVAARIGAAGVALSLLLVPEMLPTPLRLGWVGLWALVAWQMGIAPSPPADAPISRRLGLFESGTIGLVLGVALLALLVAGIARQDMPPAEGRRASDGLLVLCLGLLHLMLRRHIVRSAIAWTALGLGSQVLERVASDALLPGAAGLSWGVLVATAIAAALAPRVAAIRERIAGTAWVSDAHDLHD